MTSHPPQDDKHVSRLNEVIDFSVRPGVACVKPEIAKRLSDAYKKGQEQQIAEMARQTGKTATMSTPPEDEWTAEDIANERRVQAEINKALERMYVRMVVAIGAVAAILATAIHFLGKQ